MVSRRVTLAVAVATMATGAGCRQLFGIEDTAVGDDAAADAAMHGPDGAPDAKTPETIDAPTNQSDAAPVLCPLEYIYPYGGHMYRFAGLGEDWMFARDDCADDTPGTYLAIPDDPLENNQISQWTGQRAWIGISDLAVEGTLITVLGQPLVFTNWENGNPNNDATNDCVIMREASGANPGTWRVESCNNNRPYFCECPGPGP